MAIRHRLLSIEDITTSRFPWACVGEVELDDRPCPRALFIQKPNYAVLGLLWPLLDAKCPCDLECLELPQTVFSKELRATPAGRVIGLAGLLFNASV